MIVAIDEFPYLIEKDGAIPSIFQKIVDEIISETNILLILCGSSNSMMYETTLRYKAPLYGRRARAIEINPMKFSDLLAYTKPFPIKHAIEIFAFFGSIPAYFTLVDKNKPIENEIIEKIMSKDARLYKEPDFLLKEKLNLSFQF